MRTTRFLLAVAALLSTSALAGWSKVGDGSASFKGVGPAGFKIEGATSNVTLKDDGKTLTVVVNLKELNTGIELRDKHMRDKYLEVEKFPEATLAVPLDAITFAADGKTSEGSAKGTFSVHGKSKEVSFKYKMTNTGGTCAIEGEAAVNFKDFDVNVPSYMGITVKPDITVFSKFGAKKG